MAYGQASLPAAVHFLFFNVVVYCVYDGSSWRVRCRMLIAHDLLSTDDRWILDSRRSTTVPSSLVLTTKYHSRTNSGQMCLKIGYLAGHTSGIAQIPSSSGCCKDHAASSRISKIAEIMKKREQGTQRILILGSDMYYRTLTTSYQAHLPFGVQKLPPFRTCRCQQPWSLQPESVLDQPSYHLSRGQYRP